MAVARDAGHHFSKRVVPELVLLAGLGVEGDAHQGVTVQHRSRVVADPTQPNLRQVHLIHAELFAELAAKGFRVGPSDLGENLTTRGVDLLGLPEGTRLRIGAKAVVEVTGLRNPCAQIERFRPGLLAAVLDRGADGAVIRKAGIMGVVRTGGTVRAGDAVRVELPPRRTGGSSGCEGAGRAAVEGMQRRGDVGKTTPRQSRVVDQLGRTGAGRLSAGPPPQGRR